MWPNRRLIDLLGTDLPIIQAPMAGANGSAMVVAACEAGALGSLPCAMLDSERMCSELNVIRQGTTNPINMNFFCHDHKQPEDGQQTIWLEHLSRYYAELGLDIPPVTSSFARAPFDETMCEVVEKYRPEVVSFHFGLPGPALLQRVKAANCLELSTATTVNEARFLEEQGCDAIIAQGYEAGGHRGMFLVDFLSSQVGLLHLYHRLWTPSLCLSLPRVE